MLKYEDDSSGNSPLQKESQPSPTVKLEAGPEGVSNVLPSHSLKEDSESRRSPSHCSTQDSNDNADAMADGRAFNRTFLPPYCSLLNLQQKD